MDETYVALGFRLSDTLAVFVRERVGDRVAVLRNEKRGTQRVARRLFLGALSRTAVSDCSTA